MNNEALYPPIQPFAMHEISVAAPHVLYVEESGNPDGVPVVFLHGGPGAGCKPAQRRSFDPARYRIVLFDQRGCGRSSPSATLEGNDTQALIGDIERIRDHLGIDRWMVAGGSWGSLLSLAYAIAHPDRCRALRVHGIFLGRPQEVRFWFYGIGTLFPDAFEAFANHVEPHERGDLLTAYHTRLIDPDPQVHMPAAQALRGFSARTQTLLPSDAHVNALTQPKAALEISRIFAHYCANGFFLPENHVLDNIARIRHLPCEIVQGRYDVVTPMQGAWDLHRAWPEARFTPVALANHVATPEAPDLSTALRAASDRLADGTDLPPIETYLAARAHHSPAVSEDGTVLAWLSDETGFDQLWSRDLTVADAPAVLRTSLTERVCGFAFRPGSRDILFTTDSGGDEHHQLSLLREGAATAEPLTEAPGVVHNWGCFDASGKRIAYASNAIDATAMQIHVRDLESGEDRVILSGPGYRTPRNFTPDGCALLIEDNRDGMYDAALHLLPLDGGPSKELLAGKQGHGKGAHINAARWVDKGAGLLLATDHGQAFHGVAQIDPQSAALTWLAQPDGDVEAMAVSQDNATIAYAWNDRGYSRIVRLDRATGTETELSLPAPGRVTTLVFAPDQAALIVALTGFQAPSRIVRLPLDGQTATSLCQGAPVLAPQDTVEPEIAQFTSFDGADVPAFVFTPTTAAPPEGRPVFFIVHGGPESQYAAHWRSDVQYLVRRGWLVVAPNVRGSTGYGRDWQAGDDLERRMDPVRDLKAMRDAVAARTDVDDRRMVVSGQSYGGFMVLAAITEYPDDWCAAVDLYGIADFNTLLAATGPWRRKLRAVEYGDPDTEDGRAMLAALSPYRKVNEIRTPLFLAHGGDDPRVTPAESELVYASLRGRGHDCELIRIDHEGHGFTRRTNREKVFGAMMRFVETRARSA
ncbi:prolyl aminopeptidase [Stappia stellulata]|uniref:prolyl aminopeptidase n=1 Tax=Stappia stellulata TaxID=71235 RepID=UPI001CD3A69B|nr:prolyl aminopeptidase [Stappia stellulata]MCA1241487.1 prolyl aminopeptidase [Stappia stellulata]